MSFIGPRAIQYVNLRLLLLSGAFINIISAYIAFHLCDSFGWFRFWYAFVSCLGSGLILSATLVIVWEWFEKRKGLGTGIYFCGFTTGAVITQNIAFKMINPDNVGAEDFFPSKVSDNVPNAINFLFIIWIIFGSFGIIFTIRKDDSKKKENATSTNEYLTGYKLMTLKQALLSKELILIFIM